MGIFSKRSVQVPLDMSKPAPDTAPISPLVSLRKEAAHSLKKFEVEGKGVKVYAAFDHSSSMRPWYANDSVQRLAVQTLALGAELDDDGTVETWYYGYGAGEMRTISLDTNSPDSYVGWVDRTHSQERWGWTDTASVIRELAAYHKANGGNLPGLAIVQGDGVPYTGGSVRDAQRDTETALIQASHEVPNLFFAFVGFGTRKNVEFFFTLDKLKGRKIDNASAMVVEDYRLVTDSQVYDGILQEFTTEYLPALLGQ